MWLGQAIKGAPCVAASPRPGLRVTPLDIQLGGTSLLHDRERDLFTGIQVREVVIHLHTKLLEAVYDCGELREPPNGSAATSICAEDKYDPIR